MGNKKIITHSLYSVILFLFFTTQMYAQPGWFQQNVSTSTNETVNLTRVQFLTETGVIAVGGGNGVIKKSTDGGVTWFDVLNNAGTLWGLHFLNSEIGFTCGNNGKVYKTNDSGNTWDLMTTGINSRLWSVYFVNENTGYVSGGNGLVAKSTNGGNTWVNQYIPWGTELRKIIFIDDNTGFTAGYNGVYRTTNAGNSWISVYNNGNGLLDIDYLNGALFTVGTNNISRSLDNGISWNSFFYPSITFHGVSFLKNENKVIAVGSNGAIALSNNKGNTWSVSVNNQWSDYLTCPVFYDENLGIVTGGDGSNENSHRGVILRTTNGATNWVVSLINNSTSTSSENFRSVQILNGNLIWAAAVSGKIFNSIDGGLTWNSTIVTNYGINKIRFYDENFGVIACNQGRVIITTNGGLNWETKYVGLNVVLRDIAFKSQAEFYLCGSNGYVFKTTNEGTSFTSASLGGTVQLRSIDIKEELILTVGMSGRVYKSINNATSWDLIPTNFSNDIYDLQILDNETYVICGNNGMIRKSTNSGISWVIQSIGIANDFNAIHYINSDVGYVVGTNGIIMKTENQGYLWRIQNSTTSKNLQDVHFINTSVGNTVGDANTILRTEDGGTTGINTISQETPESHFLSQNFPNPFNPATKIRFDVPLSEHISLTVYNSLGQQVAVLVNQSLQPGSYEYTFDFGGMASGLYFYTLNSESFTETKRMLLLK